MPDTPHPPFPPNNITPRTLQRWLDVNAQGGPLKRTRGIISIPAININAYVFNQQPGKVFQLNFRSTNNFSLLPETNLRALVNAAESKFCLYLVNIFAATTVGGFNTVVRYRLSANGLNFIDDILYAGQKIFGNNFQIEFWNRGSSGGLGVFFPATTLYTSVLGTKDYRFGDDFAIHSVAPTQVTNFNNTSASIINQYDLPITFNVNNINGVN